METDRSKKGTFLPGNKGKPKGALNKITSEQKKRVEWALDILDQNVEEDLKKMRPFDRVRLWADLQEYIRPKLQRTNVEIGNKEDNVVKFTFEVVPAVKRDD